MTSLRIKSALRSAVEEERNYKICLCEDIIKAKKFLWSQGKTQHNEFLTEESAVSLWDHLYDLDVPALEVINNNYGKEINEIFISKLQTA